MKNQGNMSSLRDKCSSNQIQKNPILQVSWKIIQNNCLEEALKENNLAKSGKQFINKMRHLTERNHENISQTNSGAQ